MIYLFFFSFVWICCCISLALEFYAQVFSFLCLILHRYVRLSHYTRTVIYECSNGLCVRESENLLYRIMHTDKTIYALRRSCWEKNDRTRFTIQNVLYCTTKRQLMMTCRNGGMNLNASVNGLRRQHVNKRLKSNILILIIKQPYMLNINKLYNRANSFHPV